MIQENLSGVRVVRAFGRQKHELERLLESAAEREPEAYPGERAMYLKALVDSHVYNCDSAVKQVLETTISEEEALQAGINFEKDFMLFLHDLRQHVANCPLQSFQ